MLRTNLPNPPYKKFFGRQESIEKIVDSLLEGGIYIASIDGVGGIGKTALAYHFCHQKILQEEYFDYLVWITAKETVFDPFSTERQMKTIDNRFNGVDTFIYETLKVVGFYDDFLNIDFKTAKDFVENDILKTENIFFVLDNLESINDEDFFKYVSTSLNKISAINRNFKILTTSRKRKKILDNPIEIEGLKLEDGLQMLKYNAEFVAPKPIRDILAATDFNNIKLLEKVDCIPLGIEFVVGQMSNGKSRGEIIREFEGYPVIDKNLSESEKKKRMSQIIAFSFKDMYETLDSKCQTIFKTIAALWKNRSKSDDEVSIDLLLPISALPVNDLNDILEVLADNKLIKFLPGNKFTLTQMAYNLVNQHYENFSQFENEIIGQKSRLIKNRSSKIEPIDLTITNAKKLIDNKEYDKAETALVNALDLYIDNYKIYFEIAKLQKNQGKFPQAGYNFEKALEITPYDPKIWIEKVEMEELWRRENIALDTCERAIIKTKNEINLVLKLLSLAYITNSYESRFDNFFELQKKYKIENRIDDALRLLKEMFKVEVLFANNDSTRMAQFISILDEVIHIIKDIEEKILILKKSCELFRKYKFGFEYEKYSKELEKALNNERRTLKEEIKKLGHYVQYKIYGKARLSALRIIGLSLGYDDETAIRAIRQLLTIMAQEKDYNKIVFYYEEFLDLTTKDNHCNSLYENSIKRLKEQEKDSLITSILLGIQKSEARLREIVMYIMDYDEDELIKLVNDKEPKNEHGNWVNKWKLSRDKALIGDASLLHYSDLSHLKSIISWLKSAAKSKIYIKADESKLNMCYNNLLNNLERYLNAERNESFHSRLPLLEKETLIEYYVDINRTLALIDELEKILKLKL